MRTSPRKTVSTENHVALVLPKDYGWGMRQPTDNIWGLWSIENDSLAPVIGVKIATLIKQYGTNLDIIFDDSSFNYTQKYSTIYYWNGTAIQPEQSFFNMSPSSTLYASIVIVAIILTCVSSYFVIKNKKLRSTPHYQT
jgi:UDP-N-acetylglucosamine pyrophosphorylase